MAVVIIPEKPFFVNRAVASSAEQNIYLQKDTNRFLAYMEDTAVGNAKRVINYLKRFDKVYKELQENVTAMEKRKKDITEILQNNPDVYNIRIAKCLEEKRRDYAPDYRAYG